jgi:hypothetical protein
MKNPFSNETVKSAAIVIGSAIAFIAISKGVSALRKKFGLTGKDAAKALFDAAETNADSGCVARSLNTRRECPAEETSNACEAAYACEASR